MIFNLSVYNIVYAYAIVPIMYHFLCYNYFEQIEACEQYFFFAFYFNNNFNRTPIQHFLEFIYLFIYQ